MQVCQSHILGALVNQDQAMNIGAVLMPIYAYKKGFVAKAEQSALNALVSANLNLDRNFALLFADRADERDQRCNLTFADDIDMQVKRSSQASTQARKQARKQARMPGHCAASRPCLS